MARRQTGPKGEISKTKLLAQSPDADGGCAVATKRSGQVALAVHNLGLCLAVAIEKDQGPASSTSWPLVN
jgi:hypothetical protein